MKQLHNNDSNEVTKVLTYIVLIICVILTVLRLTVDDTPHDETVETQKAICLNVTSDKDVTIIKLADESYVVCDKKS